MTNFDKIIESGNTPGKLAEMICDGIVGTDQPCNTMYHSGRCMQKKTIKNQYGDFDIEDFDENICKKCIKCWLEMEAAE